jgi:purine nucleosidase
MNDFTVFDVNFPLEAKQRVIVNYDANNEADDQFAIVHAILPPSFDLHGIIPAHFGTRKSVHSAKLAQFIRRGSRI